MHNVGKIDRLIRIGLAAVFASLYFTHILESRFFLGLALLFAVTSLRRCCPLYAILGLGTCGVSVEKTDRKIETDVLNLKK